MSISISTILMATLQTIVCTGLLFVFLNKGKEISNHVLFLVALTIVFKMIWIVEMPYTITFGSEFYYKITELFKLGNQSIPITKVVLIIWIGIALLLEACFMYEHALTHSYIKEYAQSKKLCNINNHCSYFIVEHEQIQAPAVCGIRKPVVLLPTYLENQEEYEMVVRHEEAHIKEKDMLIGLFLEQVSILFWWNLALYPLKRLIVDLQELRADEYVIKDFTDEQKIKYTELLLKTSKQKALHAHGIGFAYNKYILTKRVKFILKNHTKRALKPLYTYAILGVLFACSFLVIVEPRVPEEVMLEDEVFAGNMLMVSEDLHFVEENGNYYLYSGNNSLKELEYEEYVEMKSKLEEKEIER